MPFVSPASNDRNRSAQRGEQTSLFFPGEKILPTFLYLAAITVATRFKAVSLIKQSNVLSCKMSRPQVFNFVLTLKGTENKCNWCTGDLRMGESKSYYLYFKTSLNIMHADIYSFKIFQYVLK